MRTSHLYHQLCGLLGQSSEWADRRHLQTVIWMVIGLICSECISLTKWGIYVQSRAKFAQSHQRRFSWWLHNSRINVQRLYSPLIAAAIADWGASEIVLIELQGGSDPQPAIASKKQARQQFEREFTVKSYRFAV